MRIIGKELREGDTLKTIWRGQPSTIKRFHEYRGTLDCVARIAEFYDGTKMSIDDERYYECVEKRA